jgi:hypothetical protein
VQARATTKQALADTAGKAASAEVRRRRQAHGATHAAAPARARAHPTPPALCPRVCSCPRLPLPRFVVQKTWAASVEDAAAKATAAIADLGAKEKQADAAASKAAKAVLNSFHTELDKIMLGGDGGGGGSAGGKGRAT